MHKTQINLVHLRRPGAISKPALDASNTHQMFQTTTLARMQETCDLLRRISRILRLGKNLQQQLSSNDLPKAANSISEFQELWSESVLSQVEAVQDEKRLFKQARKEVERSADAGLASGLDTNSIFLLFPFGKKNH